MVNITISIVLAYVMLGVSQVTEDLAAHRIDTPMWAVRPTFGKMLLVGALWFRRPFIEAKFSQQVARNTAFAFLKVILPLVMLTAFVWVCIIASERWFDSLALRIVTVAVLLVVGGNFVVPWLSLLVMPLTLIIALPIDLLFPLKKDNNQRRWKQKSGHRFEHWFALTGMAFTMAVVPFAFGYLQAHYVTMIFAAALLSLWNVKTGWLATPQTGRLKLFLLGVVFALVPITPCFLLGLWLGGLS